MVFYARGLAAVKMESMHEIEPLLDAKEVKRLLRCSLPLVYKMAGRGQIPSIRIPCIGTGSRRKELVRFRKEDMIRFIEQHYRR
jgi:predicted DNA-binding transcriptional regulator AlpA